MHYLLRLTMILFLMSSWLWSIDPAYSNMFMTKERDNGYSIDLSDTLSDKERKQREKALSPVAIEEKISAKLTSDSQFSYNFLLGMEIDSNYDEYGYGMLLEAVYDLSKKYANYPGLYWEADFLMTARNMEDKIAGTSRDPMSAGAYMGYKFVLSETNSLTTKAGYIYDFNLNDYNFGYGIGIVRTLKIDAYKFVGEVTKIGDLLVIGMGIQLKF